MKVYLWDMWCSCDSVLEQQENHLLPGQVAVRLVFEYGSLMITHRNYHLNGRAKDQCLLDLRRFFLLIFGSTRTAVIVATFDSNCILILYFLFLFDVSMISSDVSYYSDVLIGLPFYLTHLCVWYLIWVPCSHGIQNFNYICACKMLLLTNKHRFLVLNRSGNADFCCGINDDLSFYFSGNICVCIWSPIIHWEWWCSSNEVGLVDCAQASADFSLWPHTFHVPFQLEREVARWVLNR